MTRDISTSGIYFETERAHVLGEAVKLTVDFPDTTIRCAGHVVRVERLDSKFSVAVEFTSCAFE